jgi:hypothetical protein
MKSPCVLSGALFLATVAVTFISTAEGASAQTIQPLSVDGATSISTAPLGSGAFSPHETVIGLRGGATSVLARSIYGRANLPIPGKSSGRFAISPTKLPLPEPVVKSNAIVQSQANGFSGFNGISHYDQRVAGNNTQFSKEPPDQGLCAANGFVIETVNTAIRVFNTSGGALAGVDTLTHFFQLAPEIDRTKNSPVFGPFLSDPRCLFDRQTGRWFLTILMQDNGTNPGATGRNYQLIAVSNTSVPTGQWTVFRFDTTDDGLQGTPNHPGCPCFGDQPLIGIDNNGFYISTNEFGATVFNGAQIYAISKEELAEAAGATNPVLPVVVHIDASQFLLSFGGLSYSVQPTINLPSDQEGDFRTSAEQSNHYGVAYFLSALQFGNPGYEVFDNRIALWALTNTESLDTKAPSLTLSLAVLSSQTYGQPNPADQKDGPIPLANCLNVDCQGAGLPSVPNKLEQIATNDDRMNQVFYSNGLLFSGVNSLLKVDGEDHTGIVWFGVRPSWHGSTLTGQVALRGYLAVANNNLLYPSIALSASGDGAVVFTLVGKQYFPSAAYATFNSQDGASGSIHIARSGAGPDDGFSGYDPLDGFATEVPARWGDYSAAVSDGANVWFATEYIPNSCPTLTPPCRTSLANWGTFVAKLSQPDN